jgi:ADP-ribose pyrophosphatase YjhB (NUDIX family)
MGKVNPMQPPLFSVDNVLFTVVEGQLKVLLVKRAIEPFVGRWSLPGGYVDIQRDDNTDMTALRKLHEKTGVNPNYLEQLQTFSGLNRDPRGFSVTLAYFALVAYEETTVNIDTVEDAIWLDVKRLGETPLAFDHRHIVEIALVRLRQKALYSMVPVYCCPQTFTIGQLKSVIETIIDKPLQRKSLMRRIESSEMFETIGQKVQSGGRLAQLYRLKKGVEVAHFERNLGA